MNNKEIIKTFSGFESFLTVFFPEEKWSLIYYTEIIPLFESCHSLNIVKPRRFGISKLLILYSIYLTTKYSNYKVLFVGNLSQSRSFFLSVELYCTSLFSQIDKKGKFFGFTRQAQNKIEFNNDSSIQRISPAIPSMKGIAANIVFVDDCEYMMDFYWENDKNNYLNEYFCNFRQKKMIFTMNLDCEAEEETVLNFHKWLQEQMFITKFYAWYDNDFMDEKTYFSFYVLSQENLPW